MLMLAACLPSACGAEAQPDLISHVQRTGDEYFLELDPALAQALLVHVLSDRLEHGAGCFEPVSQRIVGGERAVDLLVEQSGFEIPMQIRLAGARNLILRRDEGRIEVER